MWHLVMTAWGERKVFSLKLCSEREKQPPSLLIVLNHSCCRETKNSLKGESHVWNINMCLYSKYVDSMVWLKTDMVYDIFEK